MKTPANPFPTSGYYGPDYFCDRIEETSKILKFITDGQSVTLTAIRRIGKTGLIHHVIANLPENWTGVYVDILSAENLKDFLNLLVTALLNSVPEKSSAGKKFWSYVKSLRPTLTFDALTGNPQVALEISPKETAQRIESVLAFLEKQENEILLAVDEFQQILNFPEKNTDAWLRSIIQQFNNIKFIFSGSQQHVISGLFTDPTKPFYRSTQFMKLQKINPEAYRTFIIDLFNKGNKNISPVVTDQILGWADHHTYYVQQLCNRLYSRPENEITEQTWSEEAHQILREQDSIFFSYRDLLTPPQWNLLKAIALGGQVYAPTAQKFISNNKLGGSSVVVQGLRSLMKKEMIYSEYDQEGFLFYSVYDVLFSRWIRQIHG